MARYIKFCLDGRLDQSFFPAQALWQHISELFPDLRLVMRTGGTPEMNTAYYECTKPELLDAILKDMRVYGEAEECSGDELRAQFEAAPLP